MEEILKISQEIIRDLKVAYRRHFLSNNPFASKLSVLLGQRGVGKTTILIQYAQDHYNASKPNEVLYVPVDHYAVNGTPLYEIADYAHKLGCKLICFDEIHKYSNWSMELKSMHDTFQDLKIIASGSSSLKVYRGSHDLSRRAITYRLPELSFREFVEITLKLKFNPIPYADILQYHVTSANSIIAEVEKNGTKILSLFKDYLEWGAYPYFLNFKSNIKLYHQTLIQSINNTLEVDLLAVHQELTGGTVIKLKQLLATIAKIAPYKPDLTGLKRTLDISDTRTLKTYLKHLQDTEIINTLCREGKSLNYLDKPDKIYLNNTNLAHALSLNNSNKGNDRETFFLNMLTPVEPIFYNKEGDFRVGETIIEVGGQKKSFNQIKSYANAAYLAVDDLEIGINNKIPLWLFGWVR